MDFNCEEMKNPMFTTCLAQVFKAFFHYFFSLLPQQKVDFQRDISRRNEDRALMLPNRTLQIFLSVFFSLLTQEKGRDYQRKEMKITRMIPNRTCKSIFQSLSLCSHKKKGRDFQREEMKMKVGCYQVALANHYFILFSLLINKKGDLPARGNQDRARSYQIALANLSFSLILSLLAQQKVDFQRKEMKIELGCYLMALANRSFILFSLLTQQTRWISSTQK